jgi:hypothetical protein
MTWSSPRRVETEQPRDVARSPSIGSAADLMYVVGMNIMFNDLSPAPVSPLTAIRLGHGSIGKPLGSRVYADPYAIVDDSGELHVLWGEPRETPAGLPSLMYPPQPSTSIWTARYRPGSGWSTPEKIATAESVSWMIPFIGDAAVARDRIAVAVPSAGGSALLLSRAAGKWSATEVANSGGWVSLASGGEHRVYMTYIASAGREEPNSVFLRRSDDGGTTWNPSHKVSGPGQASASAPRVFVDSSGRTHVVWISGTSTRIFLWHTSSTDSDNTWTQPDSIALGPLDNNPTYAIDACGQIHVALERWSDVGVPGRIVEVVWANGWSSPKMLFAGFRAFGPALHSDKSGKLILVFMSQVDGSPPDSPAYSYYAVSERPPR